MSTYSTSKGRCSRWVVRPIRLCRARSHTVPSSCHLGGGETTEGSMTHKISRRTFGAAVLAGSLTGRVATTVAQDPAKRGGTWVAAWGGGEPQACYVPAGGGSSPTFSSSKLFERLGRRRMDGVFEGELAEAWTHAADFKSYTIKIRKGVKFHDGKE